MKNKKGFTLAELLGVIVILGLLLLIGVPTIRNYLRKGESVYYSSIEKHMVSAGGEYMNTYRTLLPRVIGHVSVISLSELEVNNYVDKVVDENGDKCIGQVIVKKKKTDSYDYISCLKCGTRYITEDDMCVIDNTSDTGFKNNELDNIYDDSADYRIVVEQEEYEVGQTEEFIIPEVRIEHLENGEWKEINAKPIVSTKKIDTNTIGTKTITYSYHGANASIKIKVVDKVAPTKPTVVIKYNSGSGNDYQGNWYSGALYVEYKSTDYTKKNIIGSGIRNYEYCIGNKEECSKETAIWKEVKKDNNPNNEYTDWNIINVKAENNKIIPGDGEYTISTRARDKAENTSDITEYVIRIDTTAPECAMKVMSGTIGNENWYKTKITVGYDLTAIDGTTSSIITSPIKVTKADGSAFPYAAIDGTPGNNKVEVTQPGENLRIYGTLTDQAGNVTVCETPALGGGYRVKLDPQIPDAPTITAHDGKASGAWHNKADTDGNGGNVTLTLSGGKNLSGNIYYYRVTDNPVVSNGRVTTGTESNSIIHGTETAGTVYKTRTCSVAGNCSDVNSYQIKLDKTQPTCTVVDTGTKGSNNWYISDISFACNPSDTGTSGVKECGVNKSLINYNTTGETITCSVTDNAGNTTGNTTNKLTVKRDDVIPSRPVIYGGNGNNAWNNSNVTISIAPQNNISGNTYYLDDFIEPTTPRQQLTISSETVGTMYYGKVCSGAGLCNNHENVFLSGFTVKVDKTYPNAWLNSITSNASGYNSRSVTVNVTSFDNNDITQVCLMTSNTTAGCSWLNTNGNLSTTYTFPAADGSGTSYTLYAFVRDSANNIISRTKTYKLYTKCTYTTRTGESGWDGCSASCGGGSQSRTVYYKDSYLGGSCPNGSESTSCNERNCCDSTYQSCGSYGACSNSCGSGNQTRTCTNISNYNGQTCGSSYTESTGCSSTSGCSSSGGGDNLCPNGKPKQCVTDPRNNNQEICTC